MSVSLTGCARPKIENVLIVTLDTTRADRLGAYGFTLARTPNIDRLAKEGTRFADDVSAAPITLPSHSTIFTGLLPPAHGVRDNGSYALGDGATTLAERFKTAGYRTQAFVSALVLNRRYNLNQGFEGYDDDLWAEDEPPLFMIRSRSAPKTAERAVRWFEGWHREKEKERKPFFVWVHFFDPHQPNNPPTAERLKSPTAYDAEIAVADQGVGMLLAELEKIGALDRTLVVLTADHGESLGEHGEKTHAVFIYDATVRVPLIVRAPGLVPAGKVYAGPVRSEDIAPTVLAALKLPGGAEMQGIDLLPAVRGEVPAPDLAQYSESLASEVGFGMAPLYGIRHGGWKWIRAPRPEVYDLTHDPRELRNRLPAEARRGSILDGELEKILDDSRRHVIAAQQNPMDKETEETLRALGYLAPRGEREAMGGIDPKDGMALYQKLEDARHQAQVNDWPGAETKIREILAVTPRNVTCWNILALARLRQGDHDGARDAYHHSLGISPDQSRVYSMLGTMDMLEGDLDGAEKQFNHALAQSPGFVEALSNLGMIAALRGDHAKARELNEQALALDPSFPRAARRLADLAYEQRDWGRALANYRKVIKAAPSDFAALVQAGNSARRLNRPGDAEKFFRKAGRLRADSWVPGYNMACLKATRGDAPAALAELDKLVAPGGPGFHRPDLLERDPDLASVRALPGFPDLRRKVQALAQELAAGRRAESDESAELTSAP
ncbi:MAG TPA: sulfatase-like hydrolase/transferase [Thermoanaerobaculia bacterium]|nr:sulfatase-like hydrolase/transferase [Thermoanaerobaculia bacterium]